MAGLTAAQIVSEVEVLIELSGTDIDTSVTRYLNMAGNELWLKHLWRNRRKEVVVTTVAPYTTGTISITNGSTTLTGSGTTFTTGMVGRKFALSPGGPFYRISAFGSTTSLTLARAYQETDATASTYSIYQDEYDVNSTDVDAIRSIELLYTRWRGHLRGVSTSEMDNNSFNTSTVGIPQAWAPCTPTTASTFRIRLWPIPSAVYAMRILYAKLWTAITTNDGTLHDLGSNKDRLVILATALLAQQIPGTRQFVRQGDIDALCEASWRDEQDQQPLVGVRRAFDHFEPFTNDIQIDTSSL